MDWAGAIANKYAILQQQADAETQRANNDTLRAQGDYRLAGANTALTQARADVVPATAKADIGLTNANAGLIGQQRDWYGREAASRIGLQGAEATQARAGAGLSGAQSYRLRLGLTGDQADTLSDSLAAIRANSGIPGYAKGTAKVPGKGSGKVDTVKAKLAPGEAVLNKGAAETMGRGMIAALNAHGAAKMGLA